MINLTKEGNKSKIPKREFNMSTYPIKDLALKYYDQLEAIVNDLASKTTGGEEVSLVFAAGKVTIKLK